MVLFKFELNFIEFEIRLEIGICYNVTKFKFKFSIAFEINM